MVRSKDSQLCSVLVGTSSGKTFSRDFHVSIFVAGPTGSSLTPWLPRVLAPMPSGGFVKDYKDQVPRFENQITTYREWRKRVMLYARKLQLQGREGSSLERPLRSRRAKLDTV